MKKIFTALLAVMLLFSIDCHADGYTKALKEFMNSSAPQKEQIGQIKTSFSTILGKGINNASASAEEAELTKSLMERYLNDELFNDLVEVYEPYFKKHVTTEELQGLTQLAKDERIAAAMKKESELSALMAFDLVGIMMNGMKAFAEGTTPELPKKESHPNTSYQGKLQRYTNSISGLLKSTVDAMKPAIRASMLQKRPDASPEELKQAEEMIGKLFNYMGQAYEISYTNHAIKTVTEEELDALLMYQEAPGAKGVEAAALEVAGDAANMQQALAKKMQDWMKAEMQNMQTNP